MKNLHPGEDKRRDFALAPPAQAPLGREDEIAGPVVADRERHRMHEQ